MKKIYLLAVLGTALFTNTLHAQKTKLEQIPIHIYDQIKKFEINKHLNFVSQVPTETYKTEDGYLLQYSDRTVKTDKEGNTFSFTRKNESGIEEIYNLKFVKGVIFGTRERFNGDKFEYTTYKGKREDWTTEI